MKLPLALERAAVAAIGLLTVPTVGILMLVATFAVVVFIGFANDGIRSIAAGDGDWTVPAFAIFMLVGVGMAAFCILAVRWFARWVDGPR